MGQIGSAEEVLRRAVYMCAVQLAREPLLRATLRDALRERATISVRPTPRGMKEIDENHACYRYVRDNTFPLLLNIVNANLKKKNWFVFRISNIFTRVINCPG